MTKKIIITGATGLIGKKLCAELVKRGNEFTIFTRSVDNAKKTIPNAAGYVYWNPLNDPNNKEWIAHLKNNDAIIYLAGENLMSKRWNERHKQKVYNSRVTGTRAVVEALEHVANKPKSFISASTTGYYGFSDNETFTEYSPHANNFLANLTNDWENAVLQTKKLNMREMRIRIGLVMDTADGVLARMLLPFKLFAGGALGSGNQFFPWIHINDVVNLFLFALENENMEGAFNAVAPQSITMNHFVKTLGKVMHRPSFFKVPEFILKLLIGEAGSVATKGANVIPIRTLEAGYKFQFVDIETALINLLRQK